MSFLLNMAPLFFENEIKRNKLLEKQLEVKEQELEDSKLLLNASGDKAKNSESRGIFDMLCQLLKKVRLTLEEAAQDIGMSIEEMLAMFKRFNLAI